MTTLDDVPSQPRTVVQLSLINSTGDSYHRMRWPGQHLAAQAPAWRIINLDAGARERFEWGLHADLLVIFQSNDLDLFPLIEQRRRLGRQTLVELNDNFYDTPASAPIFEQWNSPLLWQTYERFLSECDGVIVTGPGLQHLFADRTDRPVHILENNFPWTLPLFEDVWTPLSQSLGVGWAGSIGHLADLIAFEPVLRDILSKSPQATLYLMGNAGIPDWLDLTPDRVRFTPWGGMDEYLRFWKPVQIGFVPLLPTSCNRCRSDIKAVEMAGSGVLPILPDALPYLKFLQATGIPAYDSPQSLQRILSDYLRNPDRIEVDARTCFDYVRTHRCGPVRRERLELYSSLMPVTKSDYDWPLPAGYHETGGTPLREMSYIKLLEQLRRDLQSGRNLGESLKRLQHALPDHRFNPDVALMELRLIQESGAVGLRERLEEYRQVYPRDLRFRFVALNCSESPVERLEIWHEIAAHLLGQSHSIRHVFQAEIVRLLSRDLERFATVSPTGFAATAAEFVNLYPDDAALRFAVARFELRCGADRKALDHFRWLLRTRQEVLRNRDFFANSDVAEFAIWVSTLDARTHGVVWNDSTSLAPDIDDAAALRSDAEQKSSLCRSTVPDTPPLPQSGASQLDDRDFQIDSEPMWLARAHLTASDLKEAWRQFNAICEADRSNAVALLFRGLSSWNSGDKEKGLADFQRAEELAPANALFLDQLAAVRRECGDLPGAIAASRHAVQLAPFRTAFQMTLADSLTLAGNHSAAEAVCRSAIKLARNEPDEWKLLQQKLAISLLSQNRHDDAATVLDDALTAPDVKRWQVIQTVITALDAQTYLEIGVEQGTNFELVRAPMMLGVDPVPAMPRVRTLLHYGVVQYFSSRSDDFFTAEAGLLEQHPPDVVFIDGKHTFEQSLRDVENCLRFLSPGGVILMHDCNPRSAVMATPANSMEEVVELARQGRLPGWTGKWEGWTGDVWKTIATLRATRSDLRVCVLDCDFGIGVVRHGSALDHVEYSAVEVSQMDYDDLAANRHELLGLREPTQLSAVLKASNG
ncbi:hypothetical protein GC176_26525 [bacterium]|nr:hypothetical protein [bacterium]